MTENLAEPKVTPQSLVANQSPEIYTAIQQISECRDDQRRQNKIHSIQEDRDIANQMGADLMDFNAGNEYDNFRESVSPPMMKATLYDQMYRKLYAQNHDLNRVLPRKDEKNESLEPFLISIKDEVVEDGDLQGLKGEVLKRKFDEGVVFVSEAFGDIVEPELHKYEDVFWDISAEVMRKKGRAKRGACRWMAVRSIMSRGSFEDWLLSKGRTDLTGKVAGGDPCAVFESEEDMEIDYHDPVTVYTFYYVGGDRPYKLVMAGRQQVEIELQAGEDYPYKIRGEAVIPIVVYTADPVGHIFTGRSWISMIKDGAEALKKTLNTFLISIPRQINPWNLLVGDENGDMIEDMKLFNAISDINGTPIISTASVDTDLKTIKPASVFNDFQAARETILDELGSKIGIQFRIQENTSQRATIFVEQRKDENEATQLQRKLDKRSDEELIEFAVMLTIKHGSRDRKFYVSFGRDGLLDSQEFEADFVYKLLKGWDGYFEADTSIDENLSVPQKITALDNVQASIQNAFVTIQQLAPGSIEEVNPIIDSVYEKIVLLKQEKVISRSELTKMFDAFIQRLNRIQEPIETAQVPSVEDAGLGGEIQAEVPQSVQTAV